MRKLALGAILLAVLVLCAAGVAQRDPPARLIAGADWRGDAILVLSGDFENRRTLRAAALFRAQRAPALVISGQGNGGDSAKNLAQIAMDRGVAKAAIHLELRARSTVENMRFSKPILEALGAERVLIVTSRRHARRAVLVAETQLAPMRVSVEMVPDAERLGASFKEGFKTLAYCGLTWLSCRGLFEGSP